MFVLPRYYNQSHSLSLLRRKYSLLVMACAEAQIGHFQKMEGGPNSGIERPAKCNFDNHFNLLANFYAYFTTISRVH
jgi:hypothetical protein